MIYPRLPVGCGLLVFFKKIKSYGVSRQIFGLTFSFLSNRRHQVLLDGKSSQVNIGISQGSINDFPDDFICNIGDYAD